jgi:AcrR family transcriptional regulator
VSATVTAVRPKRRLPAAERRARIVAAALEAFASRGYEGTSMGEIAAAAGVTRTVLYDHFTSKQALFLTLLEEQNEELIDHVAGRILGEGTTEERMRETIDATFSFVREHPFAWRMLHRDSAGGGDLAAAHAGIQRESIEAARLLLADDLLAAGIDPSSERAELLIELLSAAVQGAARWWYDHPDVPRARVTGWVMETLWSGIRPLVEGA